MIPLTFALGMAAGCVLTLAGMYLAARRACRIALGG
jgi:hypothetical protein